MPQGSGVDMGAYEMNEVDSDNDGLMDEFETEYSQPDPNDPDSDDDGVPDGEAWFTAGILRVDLSSTASAPDGLS